MLLFTKIDFNTLAPKIIDEILQKFDIRYEIKNFNEINIIDNRITDDKLIEITLKLNEYGIEIIENQKIVLVQKIKDCILEMVSKHELLNIKSSVYIANKLGHSYGYLYNLFSEITFTSIENYTILQKIEIAKRLILNENLSLTEVAFKLNYSSVAHLSKQFKNITGITPSAFQRIIQKRREIDNKKLLPPQ